MRSTKKLVSIFSCACDERLLFFYFSMSSSRISNILPLSSCLYSSLKVCNVLINSFSLFNNFYFVRYLNVKMIFASLLVLCCLVQTYARDGKEKSLKHTYPLQNRTFSSLVKSLFIISIISRVVYCCLNA